MTYKSEKKKKMKRKLVGAGYSLDSGMLSPSKTDLEPEGSRMVGNAMITRKSIYTCILYGEAKEK